MCSLKVEGPLPPLAPPKIVRPHALIMWFSELTQSSQNHTFDTMTPNLSPAFEFILSIVCYYYGVRFIRRGHELAGAGYLMIGITAFIGMFDLAGIESFHAVHSLFNQFSRLVATLGIGISIVAWMMRYRPERYHIYMYLLLGILTTSGLYTYYRGPLEWICTAAGLVFLLSIVVLTLRLAMRGRSRGAMAGASAVLLFGYIAVFHKSMPDSYILKPVDVVHICLILAYPAIYYAVIGYEG